MAETLDTHRRALAVNLDLSTYGTFAEIGAGQEVARWFLQVGGAAGTVAQTISAYDMAVSDAIYGKAGRYVSRDRLVEMLDHEYALLLKRLGGARGSKTRFFAFADTVSARNYAGTNECHGWLGLRFQTKPGAKPSDVIVHVNLRDATNLQQQQALGIAGVNLVYAAFFALGKRGRALDVLFDGLSLDRLEIDYVELSGPAFTDVDGRAVGVELVHAGLAQAVVITPGGKLAPPNEFLRKSPLVIERRTQRLDADASARLHSAARQLAQASPKFERPPLALFEVPLVDAEDAQPATSAALLKRCMEPGTRGVPVLVTRYPRVFQLSTHLRRYTREPLVVTLGVDTLIGLLTAGADREHAAGAFEALGKLLNTNVRMFVEPRPAQEVRAAVKRLGLDARSVSFGDESRVGLAELELAPPIDSLLAYLVGAGCVVPLGAARTPQKRKRTAK